MAIHQQGVSSVVLLLSSCCLLQVALALVRVEDFFPFGNHTGDRVLPKEDDGFSGAIVLQQPFAFFNVSHSRVFVNINGAVSFHRGISQYTPTCGPMPAGNTMITPFWADIDTRMGGDIYYRETTNATLLRKAEVEIRRAFPNIWNVSVRTLFIATWDKVAFFGASNCQSVEARRPRNTFQAILGTDGRYSFVIFYYNNMTWTTGTASNGTCLTGLGGVPAKAGFDVGDNRTFFQVPGSCTPEILNLQSTSNVAQAGKWIFRVDNTFIAPINITTPRSVVAEAVNVGDRQPVTVASRPVLQPVARGTDRPPRNDSSPFDYALQVGGGWWWRIQKLFRSSDDDGQRRFIIVA